MLLLAHDQGSSPSVEIAFADESVFRHLLCSSEVRTSVDDKIFLQLNLSLKFIDLGTFTGFLSAHLHLLRGQSLTDQLALCGEAAPLEFERYVYLIASTATALQIGLGPYDKHFRTTVDPLTFFNENLSNYPGPLGHDLGHAFGRDYDPRDGLDPRIWGYGEEHDRAGEERRKKNGHCEPAHRGNHIYLAFEGAHPTEPIRAERSPPNDRLKRQDWSILTFRNLSHIHSESIAEIEVPPQPRQRNATLEPLALRPRFYFDKMPSDIPKAIAL